MKRFFSNALFALAVFTFAFYAALLGIATPGLAQQANGFIPLGFLAPSGGSSSLSTELSTLTSATTVTSNTTLTTSSASLILIDSTAGNVTVTLPSGATAGTKEYTIKHIAGGNSAFVALGGADTIDGISGPIQLYLQAALHVQSNGSATWRCKDATPGLVSAWGKVPLSGGGTAPYWSAYTLPGSAGTSGNIITSDGTNFASSALTAAQLATAVAPGASGNVLTSNGTTWTSSAPSGGGSSFDPQTRVVIYEDFLSDATSLTGNGALARASLSGTGTNYFIDTQNSGDFNAIGTAQTETGTTTTGAACIYIGNGSGVGFLTGGATTFKVRVGKLSALSNATDAYVLYAGLQGGANSSIIGGAGDGTQGVFFRYTHSVNSGNWQCVCRDASVETVINTSTAPSTSAFQTLTAVVNTDATSVEFFINGVSQGTTIGANIPDATDILGFGNCIRKTAGTAEQSWRTDYLFLEKTVAR